ncbi:MAG TPA: hypothetical protein VEG63_12700, partial [Candidatus Acidoferrales bacterium]|nr:hypothetical protein [Candidatus Acidoferrales bacterium]
KQIQVRPAARLDQLEEVLILLSRKQWDWEPKPAETAETAPGARNPSAGTAKTLAPAGGEARVKP